MTSFSVFMHKTLVCENLLFELLSYLSGVQSPRFACFIFQSPKIFKALLYISRLSTIAWPSYSSYRAELEERLKRKEIEK